MYKIIIRSILAITLIILISIIYLSNFGIKTSTVKNFLDANQIKVPTSWFSSKDVAKLLEESTLYTFCN